jgi:hypothetical protein
MDDEGVRRDPAPKPPLIRLFSRFASIAPPDVAAAMDDLGRRFHDASGTDDPADTRIGPIDDRG